MVFSFLLSTLNPVVEIFDFNSNFIEINLFIKLVIRKLNSVVFLSSVVIIKLIKESAFKIKFKCQTIYLNCSIIKAIKFNSFIEWVKGKFNFTVY
jgi:hypothetical protein